MLQLSKELIKSGALASVAKTMDSTTVLKTKLNKLGFEMTRIRLSVAVNPTLSMEICPMKNCDWDGLNKLEDLDSSQNNIVSILTGLSEVRSLMKEKEYEISAVEFVVGAVVPSVHLSFRPVHLIGVDGSREGQDNILLTGLASMF